MTLFRRSAPARRPRPPGPFRSNPVRHRIGSWWAARTIRPRPPPIAWPIQRSPASAGSPHRRQDRPERRRARPERRRSAWLAGSSTTAPSSPSTRAVGPRSPAPYAAGWSRPSGAVSVPCASTTARRPPRPPGRCPRAPSPADRTSSSPPASSGRTPPRASTCSRTSWPMSSRAAGGPAANRRAPHTAGHGTRRTRRRNSPSRRRNRRSSNARRTRSSPRRTTRTRRPG